MLPNTESIELSKLTVIMEDLIPSLSIIVKSHRQNVPGCYQSDLSRKVMPHSHEVKREFKYSQSVARLRDPKQGWMENSQG